MTINNAEKMFLLTFYSKLFWGLMCQICSCYTLYYLIENRKYNQNLKICAFTSSGLARLLLMSKFCSCPKIHKNNFQLIYGFRSVVVNGVVEHVKASGERIIYRLGDCFGAQPSTQVQHQDGEMRTVVDDCEFVLVEHSDYCSIMYVLVILIRKFSIYMLTLIL